MSGFKALPLGDIWRDAELPEVYHYLRHSTKPKIPASWEVAMEAFDIAGRPASSSPIASAGFVGPNSNRSDS